MLNVRLGVALALGARRDAVWRLLAVLMATAGCALALNVAVIVPNLVHQQAERASARTFEFAETPSADDVLVRFSTRPDQGETITIAWVSPASPEGQPEPPQGMDSFPPPGTSAVSPAVAERMATNPTLATQFPNAVVLSDEGMASGDDLIAYVHPDRALDAVDGAPGEAAIRAASMRARGGAPLFGAPEVSAVALAQVEILVLGIPALVLLAVGYRASSATRDTRFALLNALGASRGSRMMISGVETLTVAIPVVIVISALINVAARFLTTVPLTEFHVLKGDLVLSWQLQVLTVVGVIALCGITSVATERRMSASSRPTLLGNEPLRRLRLVPLVLAGVLATGVTVLSLPALEVRALITVLAIIGTPLSVPFLARAIGESLSSSSSLASSLVGRNLEWAPLTASRPVVALAGALSIALMAFGYFSVIQDREPGFDNAAGVSAAAVEWPAAQSGDHDELQRALPNALVLKTQSDHDDAAQGSATFPVTLNTTCESLQTVLSMTGCSALELANPRNEETFDLLQALSLARGTMVTSVVLSPNGESDPGNALILSSASAETLDTQARNAAATLPAAQVVSSANNIDFGLQEVYEWINVGTLVAFLVLLLACLLSMVDGTLEVKSRSRVLMDLGADGSLLDRMGASQFGVVYGAACVVGIGTGGMLASFMGDAYTIYPWSKLYLVILVAFTLGLLGLFLTFTLGRFGRHIIRD